jgi:uncharacterized BrkB/YihY/UPF0761 family membrane protein
LIGRITQFFRRDLWEADIGQERPWLRVGAMALRVVFHTVRAFATDLLSLRAAGLTLVTLLALVPLFALVTGSSTSPGPSPKARATRVSCRCASTRSA